MSNSNGKVLGAILLATGSGLLVWGYQLYGAIGSKFSRALGGGSSTESIVALTAGGLCVVLGLLALFRK